MKAFTKLSATSNEIILADVPIPEIGSHELLVNIKAVGVGVHDEYFLPPDISYPYVVGIEAAGTIEKVGSEVAEYQPGARIAFVSSMQQKGGTWAEYAAVADNGLIIAIPDSMSFEQAAVLPVAGSTILKALHATDLQPGDNLFVAGGSGAIGTLAIQIAVAKGYSVAASASTKNHEYMKQLGAAKVVDYHEDDWHKQLKEWCPGGVDAAIAIQPGTASQSESVVKDGGVIVAVSGDQFVPQRGIDLRQIPHVIDVRGELAELMNQVNSGTMQLSIEKSYDFVDGLDALEKVKSRHTRGKLVLVFSED